MESELEVVRNNFRFVGVDGFEIDPSIKHEPADESTFILLASTLPALRDVHESRDHNLGKIRIRDCSGEHPRNHALIQSSAKVDGVFEDMVPNMPPYSYFYVPIKFDHIKMGYDTFLAKQSILDLHGNIIEHLEQNGVFNDSDTSEIIDKFIDCKDRATGNNIGECIINPDHTNWSMVLSGDMDDSEITVKLHKSGLWLASYNGEIIADRDAALEAMGYLLGDDLISSDDEPQTVVA